MSIMSIEIETAIPYRKTERYVDVRDRVDAAVSTIAKLQANGMRMGKLDEKDKDDAMEMALAYAGDPEKASTTFGATRTSKMTPQALVFASQVLDKFGHKIVQDAAAIRNLVTNKLIEETENADPKVRLKAYEMLGKISDVGLFTEKSEVTVTHQTSSELRDRLRTKLEKVINPRTESNNTVPAELDGEYVDVDALLGRTTDN